MLAGGPARTFHIHVIHLSYRNGRGANKDNPIPGMDLAQIDAVFSATRKCGYPQDLTRWGQLGLGGEWRDRAIQLYGRNSVSGTYGYFKEHALAERHGRRGLLASFVESSSRGCGAPGHVCAKMVRPPVPC